METRVDFVRWLDIDVVLKILLLLNDPADLIRASAVSKYWQNFVMSYGLCKQFCTKKFPQLASITNVIEPSDNSDDPSEDRIFQREHRAFASLFRALTSFPPSFCIADPVSASSTDNYPQESIINTLDHADQLLGRASYWSSKGHDDPEVPETLIYKLSSNFCLIAEITIEPFAALFQMGSPIYSSKSVRFRMGHAKCLSDIDRDFLDSQEDANDKFVWTYTSQTFKMVQENRILCYELPEPVLCIGGFLQIEFLGRVQKQRADDKYYICMANVEAIGRPLSPAFSVDISEPSNAISLKYDSEEFIRTPQKDAAEDDYIKLHIDLLRMQPPREPVWGNLEEFVDMIQLQQNVMEFAWINDDFEMDEFDPIALMMQ